MGLVGYKMGERDGDREGPKEREKFEQCFPTSSPPRNHLQLVREPSGDPSWHLRDLKPQNYTKPLEKLSFVVN